MRIPIGAAPSCGCGGVSLICDEKIKVQWQFGDIVAASRSLHLCHELISGAETTELRGEFLAEGGYLNSEPFSQQGTRAIANLHYRSLVAFLDRQCCGRARACLSYASKPVGRLDYERGSS